MLRSILFWILAVIITIGCLSYQDKTGPTYPLEDTIEIFGENVNFKFLRSETIGTDLQIMLQDPVPAGISGYVKYRRFKSNDEWATVQMEAGSFEFRRRWEVQTVQGTGAKLPSLLERAGKYEFFVYITKENAEPISVTGDKPIYARYKAKVPPWALLVHILTIFISMAIGIRTVLEALVNGNYKWMIWASIISLLLGGFVFGPVVQWYAFGVLWSGIPFGHDWTDNKVVFELVFWFIAAYMNRGSRRNRWSVYIAGIATLLVYFIPHSIFGSEYNYQTGSGHGTAG
ncbi:MAG: hypothetical protein QNK30_05605 [Bacteroidales bacterium]|nr:hypothetical protein [Bacteroidales bacterium]